jgi:phenylpyruvate tautomerase PptA (4-oxalocrotonate tautomerase family)
MPAATVEVRYNYTPEQETQIIDAIHRAMMSALKTPDWDRTIRLICHDPRRFSVDIGKGERYTLVIFDMFQGRSIEAKRALYTAIVANLQECGIPKEEVMILLREHPAENWGIRGGQAACDVDVGFKVNV